MVKIDKIICCLLFLSSLAIGCQRQTEPTPGSFDISDPNLVMELVTSEIPTPIGLAIDQNDEIYVLESHTHTPPKDYQGPSFDRIKKGLDKDKDGIPESWIIYADSIEDGMNLAFGPDNRLFLTTKDQVWSFVDLDGDGNSDQRKLLLDMLEPESPYDHAAILGLAVSPDQEWLFVSRGNTGSNHWVIQGTDGSQISNYGDGGNVMRCKLDGSQLEEVATGFWNPFDIKFTLDGRLMLTDNDPDSRGPNRLIEIVPNGDYGYKSLYGGSGIHPFVAWNGELPGTLPYAAPLGEAACALFDAGSTNFGEGYQHSLLVNIWEEKNIVRIPMNQKESTINGEPEVLVQGDSIFHPVAMAVNRKGDLYITDWVLREYPNHSKGKIWRLRNNSSSTKPSEQSMSNYRFGTLPMGFKEEKMKLAASDPFQQAIIRKNLGEIASREQLLNMLADLDAEIRLQGLLIFYKQPQLLEGHWLERLLSDPDQRVRQTALFYLGTRQVASMLPEVLQSLATGEIAASMFETYLATVQNLQPDFIQGYTKKEEKANKLNRDLPDDFILNIVRDRQLNQEIRALALPYLDDLQGRHQLLVDELKVATNESLQLSLISAISSVIYTFPDELDVDQLLLSVALAPNNTARVKANALTVLPRVDAAKVAEVIELLDNEASVVRYAAIKYLIANVNPDQKQLVGDWIRDNQGSLSSAVLSIWDRHINGPSSHTIEQWEQAVNENGNVERGELVFKASSSVCQTCHKVEGWGSSFGPDLSRVGSSKNVKLLTNAILHPSQEMAPEWQGWYVIDAAGNRHTGRQIDVHLKGVELMNLQGGFDYFKKASSFGVLDESLMPKGLQNSMTLSEFNDLIAYLTSLR